MRCAIFALAILAASAAWAADVSDDAAVRAFCAAGPERLATMTPDAYARWLRTEGRAEFLPNARIRVHAEGKTETFGRDRYLQETAAEIASLRAYEERITAMNLLRSREETVCVADIEQRAALAKGDAIIHLKGKLQTRATIVEQGGRLRVSKLDAYQVEKQAAAAAEKEA